MEFQVGNSAHVKAFDDSLVSVQELLDNGFYKVNYQKNGEWKSTIFHKDQLEPAINSTNLSTEEKLQRVRDIIQDFKERGGDLKELRKSLGLEDDPTG